MHHSSRDRLASSSTVAVSPENTPPPSPPQLQELTSTEEVSGRQATGLQTTVGLRDWHGLKVESAHLNAPSEGRAGSTGPLYPSGAGSQGKGLRSCFPAGQSPRAGFPLSENERGRSQGEFLKLHCRRKLCDSALPAPEHGGSKRWLWAQTPLGSHLGANCPKLCFFHDKGS